MHCSYIFCICKKTLNLKDTYYNVTSKMYEGHSESNASYFIMLAHDVRGGCW